MNSITFCIISYFIEFLKLFMVNFCVMKLKLKNKNIVAVSFFISMVVVSILAIATNGMIDSIMWGIISILVIFVAILDKKKMGIIVFSYIFISLIDMIFSAMLMFWGNISSEEALASYWTIIGINSISLVLIAIISCILKNTSKKVEDYYVSTQYLLIFIIGGIALATYISSMQLFGFDNGQRNFNDIIVLCISVSGFIFMIICVLLLYNKNQNDHLKKEAEMNQKLMKAQENYYMMLLKKEDETRKFRHDIQDHFYCMNTLLENQEYEDLKKYLSKLNVTLKNIKKGTDTGNQLVNAIFNSICSKYNNVKIEWEGLLPENMNIASTNLCTVFSNLLSNAFEAANQTEDKKVNVSIKVLESNLFLAIENSADYKPKIVDGQFVSSKKEAGHGYGIRNVKECVEKNGGSFELSFEKGKFIAEVIFLGVIDN